MKSKTGIVMEIKGSVAYIMTQSGEFDKIKIKGDKPSIGEIYTGEIYAKNNNFKYFVSAASVLLCVVLGSSSYAYYKPVNSLIVKIDDNDAKIQINRFNKIIKVSTTKEESDNVINSLKLKHKDINDGLTQIVNSSKGTNNDNNLLIEIKNNTKDTSKIDIEKFKENMKEKKIDYVVNKKANFVEEVMDNNKINKNNNTENNNNKNEKINNNNNEKINKNENNKEKESQSTKMDEEKIKFNNSNKNANKTTKNNTTKKNNKKENIVINIKTKAKNEKNNNTKDNSTKVNKSQKNNKNQN